MGLQDQIALLEEKLEKEDREESRELFLGSLRKDRNRSRQKTLTQLDLSLAKYGMQNSFRTK